MPSPLRVPPTLMLLTGIALVALSTPLIRWLVAHGGELGIVRVDAISFCNVLFVGNACAGGVTFAITGPRRLARAARGHSAGRWAALGAACGLSVAVPALIFTALETTTVNNVVLVGRLEPVVFAGLGVWLLGARVSGRQWIGYATIVVGIALLLTLGRDTPFMKGDGLVLLAAVLMAFGSAAAKQWIPGCDPRFVVFVRNSVSSVVFFFIALFLYGPHHFADAFDPGLWIAMVAYAAVAVVLAQLAWYAALGRVSATAVANSSLLMPVLGMLYAFLLLGEVPEPAQLAAAGGILLGMALAVGAPGSRGRASLESELAGARPEADD